MVVKIKKEKISFWLSWINLALVILMLVWAASISTKTTELSGKIDALANAKPQAQDNQNQGIDSLETGYAPVKGDKNAKVIIIEFSDFECPYCGRVVPSITKLEEKYGNKIGIYFRNFPLPPNMHPDAQKAAEASLCANEQGKFWEMHDMMFSNQNGFSVDDLKKYAKNLGLESTKFNDCLDSGKMISSVLNDQTAGTKAGVQGTPTTFVNVKEIVGACPFETFDTIVTAELNGKSWSVSNCAPTIS